MNIYIQGKAHGPCLEVYIFLCVPRWQRPISKAKMVTTWLEMQGSLRSPIGSIDAYTSPIQFCRMERSAVVSMLNIVSHHLIKISSTHTLLIQPSPLSIYVATSQRYKSLTPRRLTHRPPIQLRIERITNHLLLIPELS